VTPTVETRWGFDGGKATHECHAPGCSGQCSGAWRRVCLRHRRGWLSLEEAIQIQWLLNETVAANGDGRRRTMVDRGRLEETSVGQCWIVVGNFRYDEPS